MIPYNSNGTINFDRVFNLYKGAEARPVHNQKEYDQAVSEGFGDYVPHEYPRLVRNAENVTRTVNSKDEEAAAEAEGFLRGRAHVIAKPKAAEAASADGFVPKNDVFAAVEALDRNMKAVLATVEALSERVLDLETRKKKSKE